MTLQIYMIFPLLLFPYSSAENNVTRAMYDSMAQLVGESSYPDLWWSQRQTCFHSISPGLSDTLDLAWKVCTNLLSCNRYSYSY